MKQADIIIIGAGAAGLMAGMHLSRAGKKVLMLEARDRSGGRIQTITSQGFTHTVELGAEFVHGDLHVTLDLLKEAGIPYHTAHGDMWRYRDGKFTESEEFLADFDLLMSKLNSLITDLTLDEFLNTHFAGPEYTDTRDTLRSFVAGYDTADPAKMSAFAMRSELQSEDDEHQYRVAGGYQAIIGYLAGEIERAGGKIHLSSVVNTLQWVRGKVEALTVDNKVYSASQVIVAIPLGVLQAGKGERGAITFIPPIPEREQAIKQMGMGAVIKILLEFDEVFWERQALKKGADAAIENMSYLFTSEAVPTYWTQTPAEAPLLTGWLGGTAASALKDAGNSRILEMTLTSLSNIFDLPVDSLKQKLIACKIMNWAADDFARGSYSYATVNTEAARKILSEPVYNTIYFAGEAMYSGPEMGTVEAALASGKNAAELILK